MLKINKLEIKLISFDLWETLIKDSEDSKIQNSRSNERVENLFKYFKSNGLIIERIKLKEAIKVNSLRCTQDHNRGVDISFLKRVKLFLSILKLEDSFITEFVIRDVGNILDKSFLNYPPVLISNFLVDALNKLGEKTDLCITSNTGITSPNVYHEFLENIGLKTTFNKIFLSNELMIAKPNIKIFKIVSSYFNLKPKNCLHIGDNLFTDVFGANNSKFKSVWLNNKNKLFDNDIKPNYTIRNITDVNKLFI
jgi:FMN phosphatase YigB (HAD superfamily)